MKKLKLIDYGGTSGDLKNFRAPSPSTLTRAEKLQFAALTAGVLFIIALWGITFWLFCCFVETPSAPLFSAVGKGVIVCLS